MLSPCISLVLLKRKAGSDEPTYHFNLVRFGLKTQGLNILNYSVPQILDNIIRCWFILPGKAIIDGEKPAHLRVLFSHFRCFRKNFWRRCTLGAVCSQSRIKTGNFGQMLTYNCYKLSASFRLLIFRIIWLIIPKRCHTRV